MLLSTLVMPQVTNTGCGFSMRLDDKLADGGKVADAGWQRISKTLSKKGYASCSLSQKSFI